MRIFTDRQLAMDQITLIAPSVGMNNHAADAMAAPVLQRLYPPPAPPQPTEAETRMAAIIAGYEQRIRALVAAELAKHGIHAGPGVSAGQGGD